MAASMRNPIFFRRIQQCYLFASPLHNGIKRNVLQQQLTNIKCKYSTDSKSKHYAMWRNIKALCKFGSMAAACVGITYLYRSRLKNALAVTASDYTHAPSNIKRSRMVRVDTDNTGLKLTLFQFQTCPFCCKVRAFLDYYGFSYDVVEVNSVTKTQLKWSDYRKVPVLVCDNTSSDGFLQITESSVIVSLLETFLVSHNQSLDKLLTFYPGIEVDVGKNKKAIDFPNKYFIMYQEEKASGTMAQLKEEREWREWVDDVFVHVLSPNVYRTPSEALQSFHYFSEVGDWEENFSTPQRLLVIYVGATAMYILGKYLKKKYNLNDDVRKSLYDTCREWIEAIGPARHFMGGDRPNLADLSMYGVLSSIEGCEAFQDLLRNTRIGPWFYDTKHAVINHAGAHLRKK